MTEILDLVTSFVFVEVENDLMNVWRNASMSRVQRTETFAIPLLDIGITIEIFLLEERRPMDTKRHI